MMDVHENLLDEEERVSTILILAVVWTRVYYLSFTLAIFKSWLCDKTAFLLFLGVM
jgi:hypothetical protein